MTFYRSTEIVVDEFYTQQKGWQLNGDLFTVSPLFFVMFLENPFIFAQ